MKWKVCGLRDKENILGVCAQKPNFIGFIFFEGSSRFVGKDFNPPVISPEINKVGVFVNASFEELVEKVKRYGLDFVQLHGEEGEDLIQDLKKEGIGVIKAVSVAEEKDFEGLENLNPDLFIFDTKVKGERGGTGKKFDWNIIPKDFNKEFLLAGGVSLEDINQSFIHPKWIGWDFNSKLEIEPALKDLNKVEAIAKAIKSLND